MPFMESAKCSDGEARDYNNYVPVIASFDSNGNVVPLYFRYILENGESVKVQIDRVTNSKPLSLFGIEFDCLVTVGEAQKMIKLCYLREKLQWVLREI